MSKYSVNSILFDIPDGVSYFKFIPSDKNSFKTVKDLMIFEFKSGSTALDFVTEYPQFECIYPEFILVPYYTPTKIDPVTYDINSENELLKICHEDVVVTQLRYKIPELRLLNRYYNLTILLGSEATFDIDDYYNELTGTKLFEAVNKCSISDLGNVEVHKGRIHRIKSSRVYLPISKYQKYRISALDYLTDFISKLAEVFEGYGFELVEYEKLRDASTSNLVTFKIGTHSKEFIKRINVRFPDHDLMFSGSRVSFNLMTPDTTIYEDFRMRYNNLDLIQNVREFVALDKYDKPWRYNCIWNSQLDDDFAHEFPTNELSTYGYQFSFSATLEFFDVYDTTYDVIKEILVDYNVSTQDTENINNFTDN